jgi:hypothetical protein
LSQKKTTLVVYFTFLTDRLLNFGLVQPIGLLRKDKGSEMKAEQRLSRRKALDPIHIESLTSLDPFSPLAKKGRIVDASASGFLLHIQRKDLIPKMLRDNLSIDCIVNEHVKMSIKEMNLEIDGVVARTRLIGNKTFEIAIDFSANAPEYWRECLLELLPNPGEFSDSEDLGKH